MTGATALPHRAPAPSPRRLLIADAVPSGASGAVLLAAAPVLDGALGMPAWGLAVLGAAFLVYTAALVLLTRAGAPRPAVAVVAIGNLAWGVVSAAVLVAGVLDLTAAGVAVGILQTAFVVVIGALQLRSVRG
ncbi:MAG: hypothetical protein U0237_19495 [Thermoleophilia bacterium]